MKRTIRLKESELKQMIAESVKKILRESEEHKYKIVAHPISPGTAWQRDSLADDYENVQNDYDFISNENNSFQERVKMLMKYHIDGAVETHAESEPYIIDEDGDGLYLLKRID